MDFTPQPPIALALLDQPVALDSQRVHSMLTERHAGVSFDVQSDATTAVLMIRVGEVVVTVMHVDLPIPEGWEPAARRATVYWSEAPAAFARHRAHLVVSALSNGNDRLQSARCITAVVGALAEIYPECTAVLWDSLVAHQAQTYNEVARAAFLPYPNVPFSLWINFQPFQDNAETVGVLTLGLRLFIGREIEFDGPRAQLKAILEKVEGLTGYLLQPAVSLRDGNTIGVSETERITVRHAESKRFHGIPILAATIQ